MLSPAEISELNRVLVVLAIHTGNRRACVGSAGQRIDGRGRFPSHGCAGFIFIGVTGNAKKGKRSQGKEGEIEFHRIDGIGLSNIGEKGELSAMD